VKDKKLWSNKEEAHKFLYSGEAMCEKKYDKYLFFHAIKGVSR
jgi:hypothetical protein